MKKTLRRIFSLSLVLVLICAFATTSFAAAITHDVEEETNGGSCVYEHASIDTRSVSGEVFVNGGEIMNRLQIVIDYSYIVPENNSTIEQDTYTTTAYNLRVHSGSKTLSATVCERMEHATYKFYADIPYEGSFSSTPFTLYNS